MYVTMFFQLIIDFIALTLLVRR